MLQTVTELRTLGWYHILLFGALVPYLAIRSRQRITAVNAPPLNRAKHFQATTVMLVLFGTMSLLTARVEGINLFHRRVTTSAVAIPAAVAMYLVAVMYMRPRWRRAVEKRTRVVYLFMPANVSERVWWVVVSLLAGVSEEMTWRGVQPTLLAAALGSPLAGVLLSATAFGVAHMTQGWRTAAIVCVFALSFQMLVWLSGALYLAMAVHLAYDITAGMTYARLGKELGYGADPGVRAPSTAESGL
jgi:membrane protease YdiL (CAAX protease family)